MPLPTGAKLARQVIRSLILVSLTEAHRDPRGLDELISVEGYGEEKFQRLSITDLGQGVPFYCAAAAIVRPCHMGWRI
jgi:hypothetical protein